MNNEKSEQEVGRESGGTETEQEEPLGPKAPWLNSYTNYETEEVSIAEVRVGYYVYSKNDSRFYKCCGISRIKAREGRVHLVDLENGVTVTGGDESYLLVRKHAGQG